jgi:hypothetical protein
MPKNFDRSKATIGVWAYMGKSQITPDDITPNVISSQSGEFIKTSEDSYREVAREERIDPIQKRYVKNRLPSKKLKPKNSDLIMSRIEKLKMRRSVGQIGDLDNVDIDVSEGGEEKSFEAPIEVDMPESKLAQNSHLSDDDANPIKIMLEIDDRWGKGWREWEPETFLQTCDTEGIKMSNYTMDKIMALKVMVNTPEFFDSPRVFEKICVAFSNKLVDWGHIQTVKLHDIAVTVALTLRFLKDEPFSDDVKAYIGACAIRDGYLIMPDVLKFANEPFMEQMRKNIGSDLQAELINKIENANKDNLTEDESVQLLRMVRCQTHVSEKINEVFDD